MSKAAIYLLGSVQIRIGKSPGEGPAASLEAGKTSALLAYLAAEAGRPHARQALAALLWPERSNAEALSSLRFALSKLRSALQDRATALQDRAEGDPVLLVSRNEVQLNPRAAVWVDTAAFEQQSADLLGAANRGAPVASDALRAVLAIYRGSFLQGMSLGDSLEFESWALGKRDQLEHLRLRLLELLAQRLEAEGQSAQAEETYRRILAEQPWDEAIHRRLMRLLAGCGQQRAALAQYEACRQALADLGVEPGRETNLLLHQIKKAPLSAGSAESEPPLVARERELARLEGFLGHCLGGKGQVALITGEAGSGKTALMSAFARQALASHPDLLVVGGMCDAYTGAERSYQPFIECVQMLAGGWEALPWAEHLPEEDRERLQQAAPRVAQVLDETAGAGAFGAASAPPLLERLLAPGVLAHGLRPAGQRVDTQPRGQARGKPAQPLDKGRLFEQISRLLIGLAQRTPLVLLLDDLQWTDPDSPALLFHLARRLSGSRILILAAYRPGEVTGASAGGGHSSGSAGEDGGPADRTHPLLGCVTEIQHYGGRVRLDLDQANEQAFVDAILAKDPRLQPNRLGAAFRGALARRSGGNPLFTIELLRSLQERGDLVQAADGAWESRPNLDWGYLPERVEAAIAGRLARLPRLWLDWLATASVEGESFTAEALALIHGEAVLAALAGPLALSGPPGGGLPGIGGRAQGLVQGEGVQWVRAADGTQRALGRYRFRHILYQTYLYQQLDAVERCRRHAALGAALERLYAGQADLLAQHAAELARHFELGGLVDKAAAYHLAAGQQAVALAANRVAVAHYRRGLELLAAPPEFPERSQLEIRLYLALSAPFLLDDTWGGADRQEAIQQALERIARAGQAAFWPELVPALFAQASWLISQGEQEQAARFGEQLLAQAGETGHFTQALAHHILGFTCLFRGRYPAARGHLEASQAAYAAAGRPPALPVTGTDLEATNLALLGFVLAITGQPDPAQARAEQALERARALKHPQSLGTALIFAAEVAALRGDLPALQSLAEELLRQGQAEEAGYFRAYGLAAAGYVRVLQAQAEGDPPSQVRLAREGLESIRQGMRLWEASGVRSGLGLWVMRLAEGYLRAGETQAGLDIIEQALAGPAAPRIQGGLAQIYTLKGELLLRQGQREAARECFLQAIAIAREQGALAFEEKAREDLENS